MFLVKAPGQEDSVEEKSVYWVVINSEARNVDRTVGLCGRMMMLVVTGCLKWLQR